jgi:hypothetical protein
MRFKAIHAMLLMVISAATLSAIGLSESKYVLNVKRIGTRDAVMSCTDGADLTQREIADKVFILSCGKAKN